MRGRDQNLGKVEGPGLKGLGPTPQERAREVRERTPLQKVEK